MVEEVELRLAAVVGQLRERLEEIVVDHLQPSRPCIVDNKLRRLGSHHTLRMDRRQLRSIERIEQHSQILQQMQQRLEPKEL
jgi:hypothetical protein